MFIWYLWGENLLTAGSIEYVISNFDNYYKAIL